jgi:hypothetical protein
MGHHTGERLTRRNVNGGNDTTGRQSPDAVRDVELEESFPASDPPSTSVPGLAVPASEAHVLERKRAGTPEQAPERGAGPDVSSPSS